MGPQPEPGIADSGELERDLADFMQPVGELAQASGKGFASLIDEPQYLSAQDYEALSVSLHRAGQKGLPVFFAGVGLPTLPGLSGNAKLYVARLFTYPKIRALSAEEAQKALRNCAESVGVRFEDDAMGQILKLTKCYPYFLQEQGIGGDLRLIDSTWFC